MSSKIGKSFNRMALAVLLSVLVWLGWQVAHGNYYKSGTGLGYNLGLAGGIMILTLLLYSLRKHIKFMQKLGKLKYWFRIHMILGVVGPTLILFHTTFRTGSINAAVALYCMLLVAGSGLIGRFVYTRIHRGLYGSRSTLVEVREELSGSTSDMHNKLHYFPQVEQWVDEFEHDALEKKRGFIEGLWHFFSFDLRRMLLVLRCRRNIHYELGTWFLSDVGKEAIQLVGQYLLQVQKVAQFKKFEQIFSAWHIIHIPLMYMMLVTAVFHVIWVHMY